jgi:hypothetical protein
MKRCPVLITLFIFLAGCATANQGLSSAIEEAVTREYREVSDFKLLQQTHWQEGRLALVTFDAIDLRDTAQEDCYGISFFRGGFPVYSVFTAMSMCGNSVHAGTSEGESPALETIPYGYLALVRQDTSAAFGRANHPDGVQVRVVWDDGQRETAAIVNGSYLVPRNGLSEVQEVALLDKDGHLLATITP